MFERIIPHLCGLSEERHETLQSGNSVSRPTFGILTSWRTPGWYLHVWIQKI